MAWTLIISDTADKQLAKLDKTIAKKVRAYLEDVCQLNNPADRGHALTGPWAGLHRYRIGQLR
jgi:mRNA interferase RelE/StbE